MIPQTLGVYVYLDSLRLTDPDFAEQAEIYSTFDPSFARNSQSNRINPIREAVSQLRNIAATQAQKEQQAIKHYLDKLNYHLTKTDLPPDLKRNLRQQRDKISNLDFKNFQKDQLNFIQALNLSIQNINSYERRLKEISNPIKYWSQFNNRLEFNIQERLENFLRNGGTREASGNGKTYIARDKRLHTLMDKEVHKIFKNAPSQFENELKSLLFIDFNNWVENSSSQKKSYRAITEKEIDQLFEEYLKLQENDMTTTHFQRIINSTDNSLLSLLKDMKNVLHSDFISEADYKLLQEQVNSKSKGKKISFKGKEITYKQATDLLETYKYGIGDPNKIYSFTLHSSVSHGNFFEFMTTVLRSAVNIEGNVAGDLIIPIGTMTFTEEEQKEQKELMNLSNGLQRILTDDFNTRQQITMQTFNQAVDREKSLSSQLQNKLEESKNNINQLSDLNKQFFIAHESTKLYRGAEQENSKFEDFHGRKMAALSAMAKLYSSTTLSEAMIDPQMLMLYLINIHNVTLAENKNPLETYLSLFAGLLMFDDIKALSEAGIQQIQENIQTSTIECLHVYNIGGIYYPISVILNNLLEQMNNLTDELSLKYENTARAEIIGPVPSTFANSTSPNPWQELANATIQKTYIQIHFLAGYTKYIEKLFTNFNQ